MGVSVWFFRTQEDDHAAIMVSRYLSGGTLLDLITRSRESGEGLPVERILENATEIAHGLASSAVISSRRAPRIKSKRYSFADT